MEKAKPVGIEKVKPVTFTETSMMGDRKIVDTDPKVVSLTNLWNEKLAAMKANREPRFGRCPKDADLEDRLCCEMEKIFEQMSDGERESVELPVAPRYRTSLVAQDEYGRLIGFEDQDDP